MTMNDTKFFENLLLDLRKQILKQLKDSEEGLSSNVKEASGEHSSYSFHLADMGTDTMEREKAFLIASMDSKDLHEIDHALEKIEKGDYGLCEECSNPINHQRLEAVPYTKLCLNCKSNQEITNL